MLLGLAAFSLESLSKGATANVVRGIAKVTADRANGAVEQDLSDTEELLVAELKFAEILSTVVLIIATVSAICLCFANSAGESGWRSIPVLILTMYLMWWLLMV